MGGGTPQASTAPVCPHTPPDHRPSRRRSRTHPINPDSPPPIHPSPLPGGRLGGGWNAASRHRRPCTPRSPTPRPSPLPLPLRHIRSPPHLHPLRHTPSITPTPPPSHPLPLRHTPSVTPAPPSRHSCAPFPSFLRRQEPPLPPTPATLTPEQECRTMPLPRALTPVNPNLANADQNLTEVDTRLTKVDKGCQKLTPSTPAPTPNPGKTQRSRNRAYRPVNLRCQPLRRTLNNPEQIRTNLNKPEHRQLPRPDREAARITPDHPEKTKP